MNLEPEKFKEDESRSNPMVAAMVYPECPIGGVCFFMVVGGAIRERCSRFKEEGETAECLPDGP